jgi:uncharacterized protein (DUF58 family)
VIRINKSGYLYIALTVIIGFSAVNTGNNLIYLIASALLSYMLVSGFFGRCNLQKLEVELLFPEEVFAGTEALVGVKLSTARRRSPAFLVTVSTGENELLFPFVRARSQDVKHIPVVFPKRGVFSLSGVGISSSFPFNFFTRYRTLALKSEIVVFPMPRRCDPWVLSGELRRKSGEVPVDRMGYDSDILSIRDYVPGDPLKYINWKSTAKTGSLKTKELAAIEERPVILDMDRTIKGDLEWVLGCATYWVLRLTRSGVPVGLIMGGETIRPGVSRAHRHSILERLAVYDPNRRPD